jgi:hypothetical protein
MADYGNKCSTLNPGAPAAGVFTGAPATRRRPGRRRFHGRPGHAAAPAPPAAVKISRSRLDLRRRLWYKLAQMRMSESSHTFAASTPGYSYARFYAWRFS